MDYSPDDYFASLGGSLMKDLLADLQVDEGDWSLEQLEKELSALDQAPQHEMQPLPVLSAASMVVSHAQERSAGAPGFMQPPSIAAPTGADAWSVSLEKFTALSLEQDFLAADSVRKQQQHQPMFASLEGAEDYDIAEKTNLPPPPGLGGGGMQGVLQSQFIKPEDFAAQLVAPVPVPNPKNFPRTPHNSVVLPDEEETTAAPSILPDIKEGIPQQDESPPAQEFLQPALEAIPHQRSVEAESVELPPSHESIPPQGAMPDPGVMPIPHGMIPQQMPMHGYPPNIPPHMMPAGMPMAMPAPMGNAWQAPRPQMPPPIRAFCNPHPSAPPIPAAALESKFMNARDIAYVVHSILKPVLAEGVSENDYYIQFLRRIGGQANPTNPKQPKDMSEEMLSRANKAKEWSNDHAVLGHVAKSNVARPRALIATAINASEPDTEQKQRASLWKARIYCDQAYQSYQAVVDIWRSAPPGAVPPQVQLHLVKLMKCMGITNVDKNYQVNEEALKLLVKLSKGKTLVARILEQALLPPNAVQSFLPVVLQVLMSSPLRKTEEMTDERLFRAIATVVQRLNLSGTTLLECVNVVGSNGKAALSSTARMEVVHALLQRGSAAASQDPSPEFRTEWGKAENEFMNILQGV